MAEKKSQIDEKLQEAYAQMDEYLADNKYNTFLYGNLNCVSSECVTSIEEEPLDSSGEEI